MVIEIVTSGCYKSYDLAQASLKWDTVAQVSDVAHGSSCFKKSLRSISSHVTRVCLCRLMMPPPLIYGFLQYPEVPPNILDVHIFRCILFRQALCVWGHLYATLLAMEKLSNAGGPSVSTCIYVILHQRNTAV